MSKYFPEGVNCLDKVKMRPMVVENPAKLVEGNPQRFVANPDMTAVEDVPPYFWVVVGTSVEEMDAAGKAQVTATEIGPAKLAKAAEIMAHTPDVVAAGGFEYDSKTFALDTASMARFAALIDGRAHLTYPFYLPTRDGQSFAEFGAVNDMVSFQQALTGALSDYQQGEKAVIDTILALTSLQAVRDFVDPRL